jgi:hypothetical protein
MRPNEAAMEAPKPTLAAVLEKFIQPWNFAEAALEKNADHCRVQPPDAENRMSGGGEGSRGAIPVGPSNQETSPL